MNTHLSQPMGAGALGGQQGMSSTASSAIADADISFAIADIESSDIDRANTGRDSGANISPAITEIASRRRMVIWRFTSAKSHISF